MKKHVPTCLKRCSAISRCGDHHSLSPLSVKTTINIADLRRTNGTLYLCVTENELTAYRPVIRALLGQVLHQMREARDEWKLPPVTFFLDEFPQLGYMQESSRCWRSVGNLACVSGFLLRQWGSSNNLTVMLTGCSNPSRYGVTSPQPALLQNRLKKSSVGFLTSLVEKISLSHLLKSLLGLSTQRRSSFWKAVAALPLADCHGPLRSRVRSLIEKLSRPQMECVRRFRRSGVEKALIF